MPLTNGNTQYALHVRVPELPAWADPTVDAYLARLVDQRSLSAHTVAAYRRDLHQFFDYCDRGQINSFVDVERRHCRRLVLPIRDQVTRNRPIHKLSQLVE